MVTHIEKQWKTGAVIQLFYSMHFNIRKKTRLVFLAVWLSCRSSGKQFPSHRTSLQGDRYWMAPTTGDKPVRTLVRLAFQTKQPRYLSIWLIIIYSPIEGFKIFLAELLWSRTRTAQAQSQQKLSDTFRIVPHHCWSAHWRQEWLYWNKSCRIWAPESLPCCCMFR